MIHRDITPEEKAVVAAFLTSRLSPCQTLAAGISNFQADLAAADGPQFQAGRPDERLGALVLKLIARIALAKRCDTAMGYSLSDTTALDDFIEMIEDDADRVLGIIKKPE